jgi:hypothetical protein
MMAALERFFARRSLVKTISTCNITHFKGLRERWHTTLQNKEYGDKISAKIKSSLLYLKIYTSAIPTYE